MVVFPMLPQAQSIRSGLVGFASPYDKMRSTKGALTMTLHGTIRGRVRQEIRPAPGTKGVNFGP